MKYETFLLEIATAFAGALLALWLWHCYQKRKVM